MMGFNLFLSICINIYCDIKLRKASDMVNFRTVSKFMFSHNIKKFMKRPWNSLSPGDIIKVYEEEIFPADCIILDSSSMNM